VPCAFTSEQQKNYEALALTYSDCVEIRDSKSEEKEYLEQTLLDKSLMHIQSILLQSQVFLKQSTNTLKSQRAALKET